MPTIKPFRAIRYNREKIRDISRVVAPPYDVISEKAQAQLYQKDPHNIVRLILNKITPKDTGSDNRYTRSGKLFEAWLKEGVLVRDDADSLYIYSQKYRQSGKNIEQVGFVGLMALELGAKDKVLPHENTLAAPKKDRLSLMRAVKANLSPIFILHDNSSVTKLLNDFRSRNKAVVDIKQDGVRHRVWKMDDPEIIKAIRSRMQSKDLFIADGHHRYEVAKSYSDEPGGSKYLMVYFVEADENMLTILPTHRVIKDLGNLRKSDIMEKLGRFFKIEKARSLEKMMSRLGKLTRVHAFGMYLGGNDFYILKLKDTKALDVSVLHLFVFQRVLGISDTDDNVEFFKSPRQAVAAVRAGGKLKAAFFLNPTKVSQVKQIARRGERMPRKATYFYPKPLSGLVINKF